MPRHYEVMRLILRGGDVGDAYDRERMGCMTYNQEKYTVTVPLESYLGFAGAETSFDLDDFWCSTLSEQDAEIREFLERRVHPVGVGDCGLEWDDVLLPSQKSAGSITTRSTRGKCVWVYVSPASLRFMIWTTSRELTGACWWTVSLAVRLDCEH